MAKTALPKLLTKLLDPCVYPHPVVRVELIETHISWVLLTGSFAYKLKKPVNLGFVDFSTLDKRLLACQQELRLNRRLAPQLYLGIVAITGSEHAPVLGGDGKALEYAVRMHEFAQDQQLDRMLSAGLAEAPGIERKLRDLGTRLADFHMGLPAAAEDVKFGQPAAIRATVDDNFTALHSVASAAALSEQLNDLRQWSYAAFDDLEEIMRRRKADGCIRECHGDLHLRNLVLIDEEIRAFDCIEFNEGLRWIDVINDIAFLFMDLCYHGREPLAYTFINAWLSRSGDYQGLYLLRFYAVYRAIVRAKIAAIELTQSDWPGKCADDSTAAHLKSLRAHLDLADRLAHSVRPWLVITHGLSGSGKTWLATQLAAKSGAIHLRSDVERKRIFGMQALQRSSVTGTEAIYADAASERCYDRLAELAEAVVQAGLPVIVDATFLDQDRRDGFFSLATRMRVPFAILDCQADEDVLRQRVARRKHAGSDASDAGLDVLGMQLATDYSLTAGERCRSITVRTDKTLQPSALLAELEKLMKSEQALHAPG